jgi:hypothetical protein
VSHFIYCYAECHHADCRYTECRYAECHGAITKPSYAIAFVYFVGFFVNLFCYDFKTFISLAWTDETGNTN